MGGVGIRMAPQMGVVGRVLLSVLLMGRVGIIIIMEVQVLEIITITQVGITQVETMGITSRVLLLLEVLIGWLIQMHILQMDSSRVTKIFTTTIMEQQQ